MTCKHCGKRSGANFTEHMEHEKKCRTHLFCERECPKGRKRFIKELADAVATAALKILDARRK